MKNDGKAAPAKDTFTQITILSERHRVMLEELRFRHRLSFSEVVRSGIEAIANQFAPEIKNQGDRLEA